MGVDTAATTFTGIQTKESVDNYDAAPITGYVGVLTRGAICGGERQGLPYGCSFLPELVGKVVFWNPNVASDAILPDDWSSFCLKEIKPVWNSNIVPSYQGRPRRRSSTYQ